MLEISYHDESSVFLLPPLNPVAVLRPLVTSSLEVCDTFLYFGFALAILDVFSHFLGLLCWFTVLRVSGCIITRYYCYVKTFFTVLLIFVGVNKNTVLLLCMFTVLRVILEDGIIRDDPAQIGGDPVARWKDQDAWDREHMQTFSIKVKADLGQQFRDLVKRNGDTMNAVFRRAMEDYIRNNSDT